MKKTYLSQRRKSDWSLLWVHIGAAVISLSFFFYVKGGMEGGPLKVAEPFVGFDQPNTRSMLVPVSVPLNKTTVSTPVATVDKVLTVLPGEGCIAVSRRAGVLLTQSDCEELAHKASRSVLWYRPNLSKKAVVIAPKLHAGEVVALLKEGAGAGRYRIMNSEELKKAGILSL